MWRILAIDDDPEILQLVREILNVPDYELRTVSFGTEALNLVESWHPDLVISDVMMPGKGGLATVLELRQKYPELRVIIMTGQVPEEAHVLDEIASSFGSGTVLYKPLAIAEIRDAVRKALKGAP